MGSSQEEQTAAENEGLTDAVNPINGNTIEETVADKAGEVEHDDVSETDKAESELSAEETIALLEQKVVDAEAKADENFDLLQRKAAEFQNSKRRQEKMLSEQIDRASTHLIQKLLPILDDFDLAFRNVPQGLSTEEDAWLGGFQQVQKKLMTILEDEGVNIVDQEGLFDPNQHEAVSSEPNDDVESGHIIETLRYGYEHKGRIIRPALVRVAM